MTSIDVLTPAGSPAGSVELPAEVFDAQVNVPLIHQAKKGSPTSGQAFPDDGYHTQRTGYAC